MMVNLGPTGPVPLPPVGRPDRDDWHLDGAAWLSQMGDCTRRKVGALIVVEKRIVGLGYNGTRPGAPGCLAGACPRGRHYRWTWAETEPDSDEWVEICRCEKPWPCPDAVAPGSSYDTGPGACIGTHAEHNAVDDAKTKGAGRMAGGLMYVNHEPCDGCVRMVRNTTDLGGIMWRDTETEGFVALP